MLELTTRDGTELIDADACTISHSGALHLYRDAQQIGAIAAGYWEQCHHIDDEDLDGIEATEINISFSGDMSEDQIAGIMRKLKTILDD